MYYINVELKIPFHFLEVGRAGLSRVRLGPGFFEKFSEAVPRSTVYSRDQMVVNIDCDLDGTMASLAPDVNEVLPVLDDP